MTFAVGSATAALSVALDDDDLLEARGILTVEVQAGTGYTVGDPASATVECGRCGQHNGDAGEPDRLGGGGGARRVVLSWDAHAPHLVFTLHQYQYKTDGAYGGWTDIPNSGQNSDGAGDGSNLTGYTVTGLVGGQAHTFQVRTVFSSKLNTASNEDSATPLSAAVSYGAAAYAVDEGATVVVTVSLSGAPGREVTVPVAAAGDGGATAQGETGADWSGVPPTVTFGAADTEQTFTLTAAQDMSDDDGESVVLTFGMLPPGVIEGTVLQATVTIGDDDGPPTVTVADAAATEGDSRGVRGDALGGERQAGHGGLRDVGGGRRRRRLGHGLHGGDRHADHRSGRGDRHDRGGGDGGRRGGGRRDLHADDLEPAERDAGHAVPPPRARSRTGPCRG